MTLNSEQEALHQKALGRARKFKECEWSVIEVLQEVETSGLNKVLECTLFAYAVKFFDFDDSLAYGMVRAARLSRQIPRLELSLKTQKLTVTKAARTFSTLTPQNAEALISFAEKHTADDINREVARMRTKEGLPAKTKKLQVSDETHNLIKRARSLSSNHEDMDQTLKRVLNEHLDRHDPVRKAQRAQVRKNSKKVSTKVNTSTTAADENFCTYKNPPPKRKPLTADEKHHVFARDGGQCTHRDQHGHRCKNDRYLHIHHKKPVSQGGSNDPENLTTLCWFHHDLAHQLSLPIEGQITWLSDTRKSYGGRSHFPRAHILNSGKPKFYTVKL